MANSTADTPDVSETKLAKMRIKDLREHARERGIAGADDLHKPELLLMVKDWHYARAHGGEHRPDAPALARNGKKPSTPGRSKADEPRAKKDGTKAEQQKAERKKAEKEKAERKKAEKEKAERKKAEKEKAERAAAEKKKDGGKKKKKAEHGRDDAREAVATIRHRLAQIEDALAELESDLR